MRRAAIIAVTAVVAAGGAGLVISDGGGGSCAFPDCFPSETTTGVPSGTSLTAYSGPTTISTNDTIVDSKTISSCLTVTGTNVTIRNSVITCSPSGGFNAVNHPDNGSAGDPLIIEDSEITCNGTNGNGVGEGDFTLTRVDLHDCENGCDMNRDVLIEDTWIHDLSSVGGDPHEDGCQMGFGHFEGATLVDSVVRITFRHNRIEGVNNTGGNATSAIISYSKTEDILIEENLLTGGSYTLYCSQGPGATSTNFQVLNNHFGNPVPATGRSSGCSDETQSGNVVHETLSPLTLD